MLVESSISVGDFILFDIVEVLDRFTISSILVLKEESIYSLFPAMDEEKNYRNPALCTPWYHGFRFSCSQSIQILILVVKSQYFLVKSQFCLKTNVTFLVSIGCITILNVIGSRPYLWYKKQLKQLILFFVLYLLFSVNCWSGTTKKWTIFP